MPEPGAVLRVCCQTCGQVTDEPRQWHGDYYCPPCQKAVRIEYIQNDIAKENQRHDLEKDFHERKMKELREKLQAVEGES